MSNVRKLNGETLHLEIAEYVINDIRSGVYSENQKIPSENELCRYFETNRNTVRQAIGRLTNLGWVTPVQGKGCFVNSVPKPISYVLSSNTRFSKNLESQGMHYDSKLLEWEKTIPTLEGQKNLELQENELVYRLQILRYVEMDPISITTSVFP